MTDTYENNISALSKVHESRRRIIAAGASPEHVIVRKENGTTRGVVTSHGLIEIMKRRETPQTRILWKMLKVARRALRRADWPAQDIDNEAVRLILEHMGVEYSNI